MKKNVFQQSIFIIALLFLEMNIYAQCSNSTLSNKDGWIRLIEENNRNIRAIDMHYLGNDEMMVLCRYASTTTNGDFMLVHLDATSTPIAQYTYETTVNENPRKLLKNNLGNWVMVGETNNSDWTFIELNSSMQIANSFSYTSSDTNSIGIDRIRNVASCNGGFILSGNTNNGPSSGIDLLMVKIDNNGGLVWEQSIGGNNDDLNCHVVENSATGNICFAGNTQSTNDDVIVGELDQNGNLLWQRVIRRRGNLPEGGHDLAVYNNHMYVIGISNGDDGLLLDITLPTTIPYNPSLNAHYLYNGPSKVSFANITEHNGRLFIMGATGTGSGLGLLALEVSTSGSIVNQWMVDENGTIETVGAKCEFQLDGSDLYYCGRTNGFGSSNEKGLLVKLDMNGTDNCVDSASITVDKDSMALIVSSLSSIHCDYSVPTNCILSANTWAPNRSIPNVLVPYRCPDTINTLKPGGFIKKMNHFVSGNPQNFKALDIVKLSDNEYVMLTHSEQLVAGFGDFMLVWFDATGAVIKSAQYGTELDDIPLKLFYQNQKFYVVGHTNDNDSSHYTNYNLFAVSIDDVTLSIVDEGTFDIFKDSEDLLKNASPTIDGGLILSGVTDRSGTNDHVHLKVGPNCQQQWVTEIALNGSDNLSSAVEDNTGFFWITGTVGGFSGKKMVLGRLNPGGQLLWLDLFTDTISSSTRQAAHDIEFINGKAYITGMHKIGGSRNGMAAIHTPGGSTQFVHYGSSSKEELFVKVEEVNGRKLLIGRFWDRVYSTSQADYAFVEIDTNGIPQMGRYIGGTEEDKWEKSRIVQHNISKDYYFTAPSYSYTSSAKKEGLLVSTSEDLFTYCDSECETPDWDTFPMKAVRLNEDDYQIYHDVRMFSSQFLDDDSLYLFHDECSSLSRLKSISRKQQQVDLQNNITIYPNPNNGDFTVKLKGTYESSHQIKLLDLQGKLIYESNLEAGKNQIVINDLNIAKGIYILRHTYQDQVELKKLIIQ